MSGVVTTDIPEGPARDTRPAYNPSVLLLRVQAILGADGIEVVLDAYNSPVAVIACADLLRALGVRPESAPWRP